MVDLDPTRLNVCDEHEIMLMAKQGEDRREHCPACELDDVNVEPDSEPDQPPSDLEFRNRLSFESMVELYQQFRREYPDADPFIAVDEWRNDTLPSGYTETERQFNVFGYHSGAIRKYVAQESNAKQTIENLAEAGDEDGE